MSRTLTWIDRLRIERVVWSLDQRLYDLPRQSRIAKRRGYANLREDAHDVGTSAALSRLGSSEALAKEYLTAEFGEGPRHSWLAAALFAMTGILVGRLWRAVPMWRRRYTAPAI